MNRTKKCDVKRVNTNSTVPCKESVHITAPFYELVLQIKN
jgi:hypothetical protein